MTWRDWLPQSSPRTWQSVLLGAGLGVGATALRLAVIGPLGDELPFITFFPALIVASVLGGIAGGLSCLAVATLAAVMWLAPHSGPLPWAVGALWASGGLIVVVAAALSDTVRALRRSRASHADAEGRLQTLVNELAHRNRNALFVIMSIVSQSAREASSVAEAERTINGRLEALLRAQDLMVKSSRGRAALGPLLEATLAPFGPERFDTTPWPDAEVETDAAMGLGLVFHELATNALKHGALSRTEGRVRITWTRADGQVHLSWREVGGPAVSEPVKQGFGTRLLGVALVPEGGGVERRFESNGVVCVLRIPVAPAHARPTSRGLPGSALARDILVSDAAGIPRNDDAVSIP